MNMFRIWGFSPFMCLQTIFTFSKSAHLKKCLLKTGKLEPESISDVLVSVLELLSNFGTIHLRSLDAEIMQMSTFWQTKKKYLCPSGGQKNMV